MKPGTRTSVIVVALTAAGQAMKIYTGIHKASSKAKDVELGPDRAT